MEEQKIHADSNAIFLHTGGAQGLWTKEHLDSMNEAYWKDEKKDHVTTWIM